MPVSRVACNGMIHVLEKLLQVQILLLQFCVHLLQFVIFISQGAHGILPQSCIL